MTEKFDIIGKPIEKISPNPFVFLWDVLNGYRRWAVLGIFSAFLLSWAKMSVPVWFSKIVGYFAEITPDTLEWKKLSFYLTMLIAMFLLTSLLRFVREYVESVYVRNPMRAKLSLFGVEYIAKHSLNYLNSQKAGQLSEKILGLKDGMSRLHIFCTRMSSCLFLLGICFYYIGRVNLWFVLMTVVFGLISSYYSYKTSFVLVNMNKRTKDRWDSYIGEQTDSVANILTVKLFGKENSERKRILKKFDNAWRVRFVEVFKMQSIVAVQSLLLAVFEISGSALALWLWYKQIIGVEQLTLVLLLQRDALSNFNRFMEEIANMNRHFGEVAASMMPFLQKHEIVDLPNAKNLKVKNGKIEFKNVSFGYEGKRKIFKNFNLTIEPRQKVGIVGVSGGGKTTLINLLLRLFEPQSGKIAIDGQDIGQIKHQSLMKNIAFVPQDAVLFNRTIKQNLVYGKIKATKDEIEKAAQDAEIADFIEQQQRGYNTLVGERGIKLSGGQRQRVAIARAILKDSPIMILDEATSSLDNLAQAQISNNLAENMKNKTVIAVAHRLSTLQKMDRIIVMKNGKIIEDGTPNELLDKNGDFARLWNLQTD